MKYCPPRKELLPVLVASFSLLLAGGAPAQTLTVLHNFNVDDDNGSASYGALLLSGNTLYGTTSQGGSLGYGVGATGTVFAVKTDGTGFTILHSFGCYPYYQTTNGVVTIGSPDDGEGPYCGLVSSGNTLYGTTEFGGYYSPPSQGGTVFAVNTDGSSGQDTSLDALNDYTGIRPNYGSLVLSGNLLYGTTSEAGTNGGGTVFVANTSGTFFTNLHYFSSSTTGVITNGDGDGPLAGMVLSGNTLYGTTALGGTNGSGTVFSINTDGTGFRILHQFSAWYQSLGSGNLDGGEPMADLVLSGDTLYGTTEFGGTNGGYGTVFAINTNGMGFTNLYVFGSSGSAAGAWPRTGLVLSGKTLYGTTGGGDYVFEGFAGTVFSINTDGTGFTNLYTFTGVADGGSPNGLIKSGTTLYGTTVFGGTNGDGGTVFSLSFSPQLTIMRSGTNFTLTWPTNGAGFDYSGFALQSAGNLASESWSNVTSGITTVGANYVFTNTVNASASFFRLMELQSHPQP